jgi:hypothetical protein
MTDNLLKPFDFSIGDKVIKRGCTGTFEVTNIRPDSVTLTEIVFGTKVDFAINLDAFERDYLFLRRDIKQPSISIDLESS